LFFKAFHLRGEGLVRGSQPFERLALFPDRSVPAISEMPAYLPLAQIAEPAAEFQRNLLADAGTPPVRAQVRFVQAEL